MQKNQLSKNPGTECFPIRAGPSFGPSRTPVTGKISGGQVMPKRLRAMLLGTEDAVPGDYILALVAIFGVIIAVLIGMIS